MASTWWFGVFAAGCAYEAPVDPEADPVLGAIGGEVVFASAGGVGTTYVTMFLAEDPGPPAGTGSPTSFAAVPASAYTGAAAGLQSAPFALTHVPGGAYLLTGLMDLDGDFNPFASVLAGATCGDWVGAHVTDLGTGALAQVVVTPGQAVDDVTVVIGQPMLTERPVFTFQGPAALDLAAPLSLFRVEASAVGAPLAEGLTLDLGPACAADPTLPCGSPAPVCACDPASPPCATGLPVWLVDADNDGAVDPYPAEAQAAAGVLDVWPRVYLTYAGELPTFPFEGQDLPERWVAEGFPMFGEILVAAGYAQVPPGVAAGAFGPPGAPFAPFQAHELSVSVPPVFRHYHAGGAMGVDVHGPFDLVDLSTGVPVSTVPSGPWAVTVVSYTGQTWTVPNEAGEFAPDQAVVLTTP